MKEHIQSLVANGKTEEALKILQQNGIDDALLLQAQFTGGKKQYNLGLVDFGEWQRIVAKINYGVLELAGNLPSAAAPDARGAQAGANIPPANNGPAVNANPANNPAEPKRKAFISYSHSDQWVARVVKSYLEDEGIEVFVDFKHAAAGEYIEEFIVEALKKNDFVITIISKDSLTSGWVNVELNVLRVFNQIRQDSNWIPLDLDNSFINPQFVFDGIRIIDQRIAELEKNMQTAIENKISPVAFDKELSRYRDVRNNLSATIDLLKSLVVLNINKDSFEVNMPKVVRKIKGN